MRRAKYSSARSYKKNIVVLKTDGELKGVDTDLSVDPVLATTSTNDDVIPLNLVVPGNGSFNRVGRKIHMKSLRLKGSGTFEYGHNATTSDLFGNNLRMVVVYDKQPSGVLPTFADIFGTTTQAGTEASRILDPPRYDNMGRFRVLMDRCVTLNPVLSNENGGTADLAATQFCFDEYIKLKNLETVYSGQSDPQTIADISTGALYFIPRATLNLANISNFAITTFSHARLRYTD